MKIRNKMAIALRMARKKLLVSVILFWIGLICFSLFGRMWTEYRNSGRWIAEYQKIQNFDATKCNIWNARVSLRRIMSWIIRLSVQ